MTAQTLALLFLRAGLVLALYVVVTAMVQA